MPPCNARGRTKSLTGVRGAQVESEARGVCNEGDDDNHQELMMGGGASAPGGNIKNVREAL